MKRSMVPGSRCTYIGSEDLDADGYAKNDNENQNRATAILILIHSHTYRAKQTKAKTKQIILTPSYIRIVCDVLFGLPAYLSPVWP